MKKVSNEFINLSKKVKIQDLKLTINDGELTVQEVHLMPVNIFNAIPISRLRARKQVIAKELKYSFEGRLFKTIMQQIEITVKNASEIKGKYVDFQYGIKINDEFEYVDMGEYYIKDIEDDKNKEELVVTGYDKMLNFMKPFKQSDLKLTYPCKMSQLVNRMGEVCGVELYSTNFFNSDLIVDEDFFTTQELTYRDVLEKIAQATLTTIFIKDGKLYLCKISDSVQTLDTSFLSNLVVGEKFGPVNALILGRGSVEDNIESVNQDSINKNGRCEIRFNENEFVDSKREEIIDSMLQQIDGLEYYSIEASNLGLLWLEPCDVITAKDREESEYKTIYLKANVTINTGIKGEMEAGIPEETTTEYKVTTKEEKKTLKVERLAKKNEGLIQDIIEENTETSEKLTKVEQTVDSISQKVSDIEDVTNAEEGNTTITLENCVEGDLLELHIYGNNTVFEYLYPSDTLYPDNDLYPYGDSRIVVKYEDGTSKIYELGVLDVLRQNGTTTDEYVLEKGEAKVIRRISKDGSILANEMIEDLGKYSIKLKEGINTITIQNYTAKLSAKFAIKNDYTEIFATKVEMQSSITQTAEEINSSVDKKIDDTKVEMNSTISQTAEEINSQVSKKVGEDEIISKINQSAEAVGIDANKIELSANDILNLLAGNTINLSSKNIVISSNNFNVDENGNMECKNVAVTGGSFNVKATTGATDTTFRITNGKNTDEYMYAGPVIFYSKGSGGYIQMQPKSTVASNSILILDGNDTTIIRDDGITTPKVTQTSLESEKKNFEEFKNAIDIIKNIDIYKYNLKNENDGTKKHIGFVIGDKFNYSREVTSEQNDGVDIYSFASLCCQAIKEQQEIIEQLQEKIKELEEK